MPHAKMASVGVVCRTPSEESGSPGSACLWPSLTVKVAQGLSPLSLLTQHGLLGKYTLEVSHKG